MRNGGTVANPYLEQEIMSASPIRLRQMLINRAHELCSVVDQMWTVGQIREADGWLLRIRDILGELLAGVRDESNVVARPTADFYVFLLKMLTEISESRSSTQLSQLQDLLAIENETWRLLNERERKESTSPFPHVPSSHHIPSLASPNSYAALAGGEYSLNLEL